MKYGNFKEKVIDLSDKVADLKTKLITGEIERSEYNKQLSLLQLQRLTQIVATNGGYQPKRKGMKKKYNIANIKEKVLNEKQVEYLEEVLEEIQGIPKETIQE